MFSKLSFGLFFISLNSEFLISSVNGGYTYCDNEYNTSSCANTTLDAIDIYYCRGFLSCKDSDVVDTACDLFCQGDRSCKNVNYDNNDNDELWAYGYQGADSLTMSGSAQDAYCYGYQSCLDIVFAQTTTDNDAEAYGYQAMMNAYIDYSDSVESNGYESLYYATINTTSVTSDEIDITVHGYYGSYETDVLCQDGMTCNFYAYGYYATEETYFYCLPGAECNVYCGETNGCVGMNLYCYSTATCYFDCDDASECPTMSSAYSLTALAALQSLTKEEKDKFDGQKRYTDDEFNKIMQERLNKKYQKQYEFKQERLREEKTYNMKSLSSSKALLSNNNANAYFESTAIESGLLLVIGMFIGILSNYGYNKCMTKKDYQYQSIV